MRLKEVEEILKSPVISMRFYRPEPIDKIIKEYQMNELNRHGSSSTIQQLVIHMMLIGKDNFVNESENMRIEFEEYQKTK